MKHKKITSLFIISICLFAILFSIFFTSSCASNKEAISKTDSPQESGTSQTDDVIFPDYSGYINDYASKLDQTSKDRLEELSARIEKDTGSEIAVAIVNNLGGLSQEEYALRLFEKWGIGKEEEDNGILILIGIEGEEGSRPLRMEVGYGLEGVITDLEAGYILDEILIPRLQEGDFYTGLYNAIVAIGDQIYVEKGMGQIGGTYDIVESQFEKEPALVKFLPLIITSVVLFPFFIIILISLIIFLKYYISLHKCPSCNKLGLSIKQTTIEKSTYKSKGKIEIERKCKYCGFYEKKIEETPKLYKSSGTSSGSSFRSSSGYSSSSGHSGGFGGFGGGFSGGGGASRGW